MAIMIPDVCPADTSNGEKVIFDKFKNDKSTNDWFVLHSLDIADHIRQERGEADFIIIIPQKGVFCLEVKGASSVRREQGAWYYGSSKSGVSKSPFRQASEAMFSIKNRLSQRLPKTINPPMCYSGVVFPFIEIDSLPDSDEWNDWELIDSEKLLTNTMREIVSEVIDRTKQHHSERNTAWFDPLIQSPKNNLEKIAIQSVLRPDFEFFESPISRLKRSESEIKHYTEEQFAILDGLAANRRVLIDGPAGTGKTFLAIENARRYAEEGMRTLLCCYNNALSQWISAQMPLNENLTVSTFHRLMEQFKDPKHKFENYRRGTYWDQELPDVATKSVLKLDNPPFDVIVIDEAQDLIKEPYMAFLDALLAHGLQDGKWSMFGDLENQAIYGTEINHIQILNDNANYARLGIRDNCRNTPVISNYVTLLSELNPPYKRTRRETSTHNPQISYYSNHSKQSELLINILEELQEEKMPAGQTVILGPTNYGCGNDLLKRDINDLPCRIQPLNLGGFTQIKKVIDGISMDPPTVDDYIKYAQSMDNHDDFYTKLLYACAKDKSKLIELLNTSIMPEVRDLLNGPLPNKDTQSIESWFQVFGSSDNLNELNINEFSRDLDHETLATAIHSIIKTLGLFHSDFVYELDDVYGNILYDMRQQNSPEDPWELFVPYAWTSTIHSFKGLESPVVIVTDMDDISSEYQKRLLYIAMTRPTERLYILAETSQKKLIDNILIS